MTADIEKNGFALVSGAIPAETVHQLVAATAASGLRAIERRGSVIAVRDLFNAVPEVRDLARTHHVRDLAEGVLGPDCFAVRGILFDKTPQANWKVAWHQDLTIAVQAQREVPGFGPWSEKAGIPHVQPPTEILSRMVTVRIHLDDCGAENGPVQVVPGSHQYGKLSPQASERLRRGSEIVTCEIDSGGALVMRPLLLHASSPANSPAHRRVVHLEFAVDSLPDALEWHERL